MTDASGFRSDIERVPQSLFELASVVEREPIWPIVAVPRRLLLLGMGSSHFAAEVCARRLRAAGVDAVAELASAASTWPASHDLTVVAISAGGSSAETLHAIEPHAGTSRVIALTNRVDSELAGRCDSVVSMHAGVEAGGVACRTYRNTVGCLLTLESQLLGEPSPSDLIRRAADASADLLQRSPSWLPDVLECADSPDGLWLLAPAERIASALQGALLVREGPRRRADGCETGDWSHVDVYLTKMLDYRAIVYAGSVWDGAAAQWLQARRSTSVAVGGSFPGARYELRYDADDDTCVALLTEPLVAELLAAEWWQACVSNSAQ
jgi:glucosamine 6-phosphate synthetase-like amidotransferase/phosphosugar isomerase protein